MDWRQQLTLSVKAAVAAALAWSLVQPLGGVADDYPYYAPLGAVLAVTTTVAGSIRGSLQSIASILVGAALAVLAQVVDAPMVLGLAFVVAVGTVLGGWGRLGSYGAWVPISGLFVLIIGREDLLGFALAYPGLTSMGAVVGIVVNTVFPPLALTPMATSIDRLRTMLTDQLDDLAEGLLRETAPSSDDWKERQWAVRPTAQEVQRVVGQAAEDRRANWRERRWSRTAERRYQQARALQHVAFLIEDITALVVDQERSDRERVALGRAVRPEAAHALQELADVLRSVDGEAASIDVLRRADAAVTKLVHSIREERQRSESDMFAAGTIVTGVRRAMASLVPADARDELPTDW
jgi:uncharacterized membrane protein YgaE (UPF0421/DUF939 family)